MDSKFKVVSDFNPMGDQIQAIEKLSKSISSGCKDQTLLGVTGSGKTFTVANIIEKVQKPTIVFAHNKTLAAQLCSEFKEFFPNNAVEFYISYYDYYQPEAYVKGKDLYIEKDALINQEIEKLRHSATASISERKDVIIVASVSCIYGLGTPDDYVNMVLSLRKGMEKPREEIIKKLIDIQYIRNDINFDRGTFRVRGDILDIYPIYSTEKAIRVEFFGDEIDRITEINVVSGQVLAEREHASIYPSSHYVVEEQKMKKAIGTIEEELQERLEYFNNNGMLLEAQRLEQRTKYDLEMMQELGFCSGIENYSRHLTGLAPGERPYVLFDYFPDDFLLVIDESHVTLSQVKAMYGGDRSRKLSLVENGFRLPSALDNRPLNFDEFEEVAKQKLYVSATPGLYEKEKSKENYAEQIIRPTGILDPEIFVRPIEGQIDDLIHEVKETVDRNGRILVTTLTKKMAESLTEYLQKANVKVNYMHSDIDSLERMEIIRDLRRGDFDVLVGINLLREGLDIPEVKLVAILDADKEGFLRSRTSLVQTVGRAARNIDSKVIMYADRITDSMKATIDETNRRRKIQKKYNEENNIIPKSVEKSIRDVMKATKEVDESKKKKEKNKYNKKDLKNKIKQLELKMQEAAINLEFEAAASYRDEMIELSKYLK